MKSILTIAVGLAAATAMAAEEPGAEGQQRRQIKSLSASQIESLEKGEGMGFAKAAELNHYPGPRHVIDLADELDLSLSQLNASRALFDEMQKNARALGQRLLKAEAALDRAFAEGAVDAQALQSQLEEIGKIHAQLRYVHLEAHVRQRRLLTETQVSSYDALRGYDGSSVHDPGHMRHHE